MNILDTVLEDRPAGTRYCSLTLLPVWAQACLGRADSVDDEQALQRDMRAFQKGTP